MIVSTSTSQNITFSCSFSKHDFQPLDSLPYPPDSTKTPDAADANVIAFACLENREDFAFMRRGPHAQHATHRWPDSDIRQVCLRGCTRGVISMRPIRGYLQKSFLRNGSDQSSVKLLAGWRHCIPGSGVTLVIFLKLLKVMLF